MSSTSIGPISGIDYGKLITGLTQTQQAQIDAITTRTDKLSAQNDALNTLATLMTGLKISSTSFSSSGVFKATTATSSNTGILNASAGVGTPVGNYTFAVQRLASASQVITQGFADASSPLGLAGTVKIRLGGGVLDDSAKLSTLNGGGGVARGSVRITDRSGASTLVDLSDAVDINDVVDAINTSTGVSVSAAIKNDHLVLTDTSGGSGTLAVANAGGTTTAGDLGLTATASGGTLTGTSITTIKGSTLLTALNDGNGVRNGGGVNDFSITGAGGTVNVTISGAKTVADVISKINSAGSSTGFTAAISADGHGITLSDSGGGPLTVAALNGSLAAYDLGIQGASSNGTLAGDQVTSGLRSPLLKNLAGGYQGQPGETVPQYGTITINSTSVDLSGARTVNDVISAINASGTGVTAALNDASTGITLTSSSGSFTVADGTGNLASFLNIAGTSTATATGSGMASGDLHLRYVSESSSLSVLSGGSGFKAGKIRITDGTGASQLVDLSTSGISTVGDVIKKLNNTGLAVSARINDTGDGILLTQTSGTGTARVEDFDSTKTAESLGILGTFSSGKLDGSLLKTITIAATDTLSDISSAINNAGAGVSVSIINDGSGDTPYRLSLASRNSGTAGRLVFDGSGAGLAGTTLVQGEDAVLVYGGTSKGTGGLTATSSTNAITGLVSGLTLNLTGLGQASVAVTRDNSKISDAVQSFVDSYNKIITHIADVTKFNSDDQKKNGVLFGDATVQQAQQALGRFVTRVYSGVGQYATLASVGVKVGEDGTLTLDSDKLTQVLASNPDDVRALFTTNIKAVDADLTKTPPVQATAAVKGVGATLSDLLSQFTDASTGTIFRTTDALASQATQLKKRQTELNTLLVAKKNAMILQFANLEVTISKLQQQGTSLSSLSTSTSSSK